MMRLSVFCLVDNSMDGCKTYYYLTATTMYPGFVPLLIEIDDQLIQW
jgi:hypothetical protein